MDYTKVKQYVIKPLTEHYGEPNWGEKGKNKDSIMNSWVKALTMYKEVSLERGVTKLIETRDAAYFPTLSQVIASVKNYEYVDNSVSSLPQDLENWYNTKFLDTEDTSVFTMNSRYKALNVCLDMVDDYNQTEDINNQLVFAWNIGIIKNNFDNLERQYDKELLESDTYKKGRNILKKVYLAYKKGGKKDVMQSLKTLTKDIPNREEGNI